MSTEGKHRRRVFVALLCASMVGCGDSSGETGGTGGTPTNCASACNNEVDCNDTPRTVCEGVCDAALLAASQISNSCFDAVNDVLGCAGALSCTDYEAWQNETPPDGFPCQAETEACDTQCNDLCDQEFDF